MYNFNYYIFYSISPDSRITVFKHTGLSIAIICHTPALKYSHTTFTHFLSLSFPSLLERNAHKLVLVNIGGGGSAGATELHSGAGSVDEDHGKEHSSEVLFFVQLLGCLIGFINETCVHGLLFSL